MPTSLVNSRSLTLRALSLTDAIDGSNAAPGSMAVLQNLIPAPHTRDLWIPRPATTPMADFSGNPALWGTFVWNAGIWGETAGFTTPGPIELLFVAGSRVYGMIGTGRFAGKSEPFIFDTVAGVFIPVAGVTNANTPATQPTTGDWTPPRADQVGAYVLVAHPGFAATGAAFGWFDMTGFTNNTLTGTTHNGANGIDTLSTNPLVLGLRPGLTISGTNIPANTTIVSLTATTITISNNMTGTTAGVTLTTAGGTFAAPLWAAGNTAGFSLINIATDVAQFADSACYAVNTVSPPSAAVVFSDAGDPLIITNAGSNQGITFLNALPVTALKGLPLSNVTGGIIQALMAFQGDAQIQQLTGTPILKNLQVNTLSDTVGTQAPNSIANTPLGMMFVAPDGLRIITPAGQITEAIGEGGGGITTPFIYAQNPSRIAAAYNEDVYRVSVKTLLFSPGQLNVSVATMEYWFHIGLKKWSGPHTFPAALIQGLQAPHGFVMATTGINAKLWNSPSLPSTTTDYTENGTQMTFRWLPSLLPDNETMSMNSMLETTITVAIPQQQNVTATATDQVGAVIGAAQLSGPPTSPSLWGGFTWGAANWGAGPVPFRQYQVFWSSPLLFKQMQLGFAGDCAAGLVIGNLRMRWEELGYVLPAA